MSPLLDLHEATQEVANYIRKEDASIFEPAQTGFPGFDRLLGGSDEMLGGFDLQNFWLLAGAQALNTDKPQQGVEPVRLSIEKSRREASEEELRYPYWDSIYRVGVPGERVPAAESWQKEERAALQPADHSREEAAEPWEER